MKLRLTAPLSCLVASLLLFTGHAQADPIAYSADSSDLISIDLANGAWSDIGPLNISGDKEAMAVDHTSGILYLATDGEILWTVDTTTGGATEVGALGVAYGNGGMSFDQNGVGYLVTTQGLFTFDKTTGSATLIGDGDYNNTDIIEGLSSAAFVGTTLFAAPDGDTANNLYSIDLTTGDATTVGPLGISVNSQAGLSFDSATNTLYLLNESDQGLYSVDYSTGEATFVARVTTSSLESLALANPGNPVVGADDPATPVPTLSLIGFGFLAALAGLLGIRRLHTAKAV